MLEGEREKYRDHRDDLAGLVSKRVSSIMNEHMEASLLSEHNGYKNACGLLKTEAKVPQNETASN